MPQPPTSYLRSRSLGVIAFALAASFLAAGCSSESATLTSVTLPSTSTVKPTAKGAGPSPNFPTTTGDPAAGGPAPKANVPTTKGPVALTPTPKAVAAKRTPAEMTSSCNALHDFQWAMLFIDIAVTGGKVRDKLDGELDRTGQAFASVDKNWSEQIQIITTDLKKRLSVHMTSIAGLPKGQNKASDQAPAPLAQTRHQARAFVGEPGLRFGERPRA